MCKYIYIYLYIFLLDLHPTPPLIPPTYVIIEHQAELPVLIAGSQ